MPEEKIAYYLSFSDVIRVLRLVDEAPFRELNFELDGLKLRVVQDNDRVAPAGSPPASRAATATQLQPSAAHAAEERATPAQAAAIRSEAKRAAVPEEELYGTPVLAPLAGTFYRAPSPGAAPFVDIGSRVKAGDVVGILEIMKLMNHVSAPCAGVVRKICVQNEEFVEFGQMLAVVEPEPCA